MYIIIGLAVFYLLMKIVWRKVRFHGETIYELRFSKIKRGFIAFEVQSWTDAKRKELYYGSMDFLFNASKGERAYMHDEIFPEWPKGIASIGPPTNHPAVKKEIVVLFQPDEISPKEIENYIRSAGIEVRQSGEPLFLP